MISQGIAPDFAPNEINRSGLFWDKNPTKFWLKTGFVGLLFLKIDTISIENRLFCAFFRLKICIYQI